MGERVKARETAVQDRMCLKISRSAEQLRRRPLGWGRKAVMANETSVKEGLLAC